MQYIMNPTHLITLAIVAFMLCLCFKRTKRESFKNKSTGTVVGIVLGTVAFLLLAVGGAIWMITKKKSKKHSELKLKTEQLKDAKHLISRTHTTQGFKDDVVNLENRVSELEAELGVSYRN